MAAFSNVAFPGGGRIAPVGPALPGAPGGNMGAPGMPAPPAGPGTPPNAVGLAGAGATQLYNTLQGAYLDPSTNPWLAQTANAATQGLVNQYRNATAPSLMAQQIAGGGGPGALNASGFNQAQGLNEYELGQNIGNTEANIYSGAYQQERQNQMQGLGLLGNTMSAQYMPANELLGAGTLEQQQQQSDFNTMYQNALAGNQYPMDMLSRFGSLLGMSTGGMGNQLSIGTTSK